VWEQHATRAEQSSVKLLRDIVKRLPLTAAIVISDPVVGQTLYQNASVPLTWTSGPDDPQNFTILMDNEDKSLLTRDPNAPPSTAQLAQLGEQPEPLLSVDYSNSTSQSTPPTTLSRSRLTRSARARTSPSSSLTPPTPPRSSPRSPRSSSRPVVSTKNNSPGWLSRRRATWAWAVRQGRCHGRAWTPLWRLWRQHSATDPPQASLLTFAANSTKPSSTSATSTATSSAVNIPNASAATTKA
jgi:hypothetical protein